MLYTYVNTPGWIGKLDLISHFACFGVARFQPLGFFPEVLSYQLLGTSFFAHYLVSIAIHFAQTYVFLKTLDRFRSNGSDSRSVFERYPYGSRVVSATLPGGRCSLLDFLPPRAAGDPLCDDIRSDLSDPVIALLPPASCLHTDDSGYLRFTRRFFPAWLSISPSNSTRFFRGDRPWRGSALLAVSRIRFWPQIRTSILSDGILARACRSVLDENLCIALSYTLLALALVLSNSIWPTAAWRGSIYTLAIPHAIQAGAWTLFCAGAGGFLFFCFFSSLTE